MDNYKGITYPFAITGGGGVSTSEMTYLDLGKIKENIEQILFTYPGERIMQPDFGCKLRDFLFENTADPGIVGMIRYEIENALLQWEPRIIIKDIVLSSVKDVNSVNKLYIDLYVTVVKYQYDANISLVSP